MLVQRAPSGGRLALREADERKTSLVDLPFWDFASFGRHEIRFS